MQTPDNKENDYDIDIDDEKDDKEIDSQIKAFTKTQELIDQAIMASKKRDKDKIESEKREKDKIEKEKNLKLLISNSKKLVNNAIILITYIKDIGLFILCDTIKKTDTIVLSHELFNLMLVSLDTSKKNLLEIKQKLNNKDIIIPISGGAQPDNIKIPSTASMIDTPSTASMTDTPSIASDDGDNSIGPLFIRNLLRRLKRATTPQSDIVDKKFCDDNLDKNIDDKYYNLNNILLYILQEIANIKNNITKNCDRIKDCNDIILYSEQASAMIKLLQQKIIPKNILKKHSQILQDLIPEHLKSKLEKFTPIGGRKRKTKKHNKRKSRKSKRRYRYRK